MTKKAINYAISLYDNASTFLNHRAAVMVNGKYGYIDENYKMVIKPQYTDANYFTSDGYALVGTGTTYKIIDKNGNDVSTETFQLDNSMVVSFNPSVIKYGKNGKFGMAKIVTDSATPATNNSPAQTASKISVMYNNKPMNITLPLLNKNGTTYYPFRQLLTEMGATITWDSASKTATGTLNGKTVSFVIDNNVYKVNGTTRKLPANQNPSIQNGSTYIPVRACAEGLGFAVAWDNASQTITIK